MNPTSMRFTEAEWDLIRAHAERLEAKTGKRHTPSDVVRFLLRTSKPAEGAGDAQLRRAHKNAFGKDA